MVNCFELDTFEHPIWLIGSQLIFDPKAMEEAMDNAKNRSKTASVPNDNPTQMPKVNCLKRRNSSLVNNQG